VKHANHAQPGSDAEALSRLTQHLLLQERQLGQQMTRALHDRLGQSLAAIRLHLELLRPGATTPSRDSLQRDIDHIENMLDQAIAGLRQMLVDLSPPLLTERGLAAALDHNIRRWEASGVADVLLETDDVVRGVRWPRDVEYGAFMIARDAINHAMNDVHASLVRVLLDGDAGRLHLEVLDDGRGMAKSDGIAGTSTLAITTMRERAKGMAASIDVGAAEGGGHRVTLHWEAGAT
jgi:signal transduction histidine kinase